jgi:histidine decarboxylase
MERYCSAAALEATAGYIAAPLISLAAVPRLASDTLSRIVAFDRAEASFANITQTNMIRVSSFNGLNGLLLGYDLLPQPLRFSPAAPERTNVFSADGLFEATRALLGTVAEPRFPIAPGQHLLCAYKAHFAVGPCELYGAMAIAVPVDRSRNADLFMEDHGTFEIPRTEQSIAADLLSSVELVGDNLGVRYEKVFLSVRSIHVPEGHIGCALTAAPYINLAKAAVPPQGVESLAGLPLADWEAAVGDQFLGSARHSSIGEDVLADVAVRRLR